MQQSSTPGEGLDEPKASLLCSYLQQMPFLPGSARGNSDLRLEAINGSASGLDAGMGPWGDVTVGGSGARLDRLDVVIEGVPPVSHFSDVLQLPKRKATA
jgi:hypothetical protein